MSRFSYTGSREKKLPKGVGYLITIVVWCAIVGLFVYGVRTFNGYAYDKQKESLAYALRRDIAECYALEGVYPPDVDYLTAHYGLSYNENLFYVDYRTLGSNLYPDVTIIELRK